MRLSRLAPGAVACLLAVSLASCGGSEAPSAALPSGGSSSSIMPTVTSSQLATPVAATPPGSSYRILSRAALKEALLRVDDVPEGYADTTTTADETHEAARLCDYKHSFEDLGWAVRRFTKGAGDDAQMLYTTVRQFKNPQQAKAEFAALTVAVRRCTSWVSKGRAFTVSESSAKTRGDQSVVVRVEGAGGTILQGFALVGPSLVVTGVGGYPADYEVLWPTWSAQVDRYTRAALNG